MQRLLFHLTINKGYVVQWAGDNSTEELAIAFYGGWQFYRRKTLLFNDGVLAQNKIEWIWKRGNDWYIDFDLLKSQYDIPNEFEWLQGVKHVVPIIEEYTDPFNKQINQSLEFHLYKDEILMNNNQKIFLSHKGIDKPLVREYFRVLKTLGFDPWLDEDAMVAGTPLERGILNGFDMSCAAVFFITSNFKDENYLATEVNYAIAQKRKKGDRFAIITIVFAEDEKKVTVPELLEQYVWKEPQSRLMALDEIIRALPLVPGEPAWKSNLHS